MVDLTLTPRLREAVELYNNLVPDDVLNPESLPSLPHTQIRTISRKLRKHHPQNPGYTVTSLLRGTSVYNPPPPPPPPKSPEYVALMARLRREQEEREYHSFLRDTSPQWEKVDEDKEATWKEVKSQVTVIFNVLLSIFATAAAIWKVAEGWDIPQRMAAAFVSAIVVAIAEVVLFGGYVRRLEEGRKKEGKIHEKKGVVSVWEVGPEGVRKLAEGTKKSQASEGIKRE